MDDAEHQAVSMLAHLLIQHARPDKAAALLEGLDALRPLEPATLRALATAQLRAGHPEDALQSLDRLAIAGHADGVFHLLQAQALRALGRRNQAAAAFRAYAQDRQQAVHGEGATAATAAAAAAASATGASAATSPASRMPVTSGRRAPTKN